MAQPPSIGGEDPANGSRISPEYLHRRRRASQCPRSEIMSAGPQGGTPRSRTFTIPSPCCREKEVHPLATLPVGPRALYLQTGLLPLRLQTIEQQSAFVLQDEPAGKHTASVVVVVLVVTVVVVVGA